MVERGDDGGLPFTQDWIALLLPDAGAAAQLEGPIEHGRQVDVPHCLWDGAESAGAGAGRLAGGQ